MVGGSIRKVWGHIWEVLGLILEVLGAVRPPRGDRKHPKRDQEATKTGLDEFWGARDFEKVPQVGSFFGTCSMFLG